MNFEKKIYIDFFKKIQYNINFQNIFLINLQKINQYIFKFERKKNQQKKTVKK
jgi:hypothetical protein